MHQSLLSKHLFLSDEEASGPLKLKLKQEQVVEVEEDPCREEEVEENPSREGEEVEPFLMEVVVYSDLEVPARYLVEVEAH